VCSYPLGLVLSLVEALSKGALDGVVIGFDEPQPATSKKHIFNPLPLCTDQYQRRKLMGVHLFDGELERFQEGFDFLFDTFTFCEV